MHGAPHRRMVQLSHAGWATRTPPPPSRSSLPPTLTRPRSVQRRSTFPVQSTSTNLRRLCIGVAMAAKNPSERMTRKQSDRRGRAFRRDHSSLYGQVASVSVTSTFAPPRLPGRCVEISGGRAVKTVIRILSAVTRLPAARPLCVHATKSYSVPAFAPI